MSTDVIQISVPNLPVEVKEVLEVEAKRQDRSLASLIRTILISFADQVETSKPTNGKKAAQSA